MDATTPRVPRTKGLAMLPIIYALRSDEERARQLLPRALHHYLSDHVLPSSWYPDADWIALLHVLARAVTTDESSESPWLMFGRSAALRDLADDQSLIPEAARTNTGGVYRQLASGKLDPVGLSRRLAKMWSLYHDTGVVELLRDPKRPTVITYRLRDYPLACHEVFEINQGYAEQYGTLTQVPCRASAIYPTPRLASSWSMDIEFEPTPQNLAAIATL